MAYAIVSSSLAGQLFTGRPALQSPYPLLFEMTFCSKPLLQFAVIVHCLFIALALSHENHRLNMPSSLSRITPIIYSSSTCSISGRRPIILTGPVSCPCFVRYIIVCDLPTTWDIFFLPEESYIQWKLTEFQTDPPPFVSQYSTLQASTLDSLTILFTPDTTIMMNGTYRIFVRTNTDERRCLSDIASVLTPTSVVLESIPTPCPLRQDVSTETSRVVGGSIPTVDKLSVGRIVHRTTDELLCTATLISENGYAVTAGHCVKDISLRDFEVRFGFNETLQSYDMNRVFVHPSFRANDAFNRSYNMDAGVVELTKYTYDASVFSPLRLADLVVVSSDPRVYASVYGFGLLAEGWTSEFGAMDTFRRVDVPLIPPTACAAAMTRSEVAERINGSIHLCAGSESGCDACAGDEGSPLVFNDTIIGVASSNVRCGAVPTQPTIYTRMSAVAPWVQATVAEAFLTRTDLDNAFWKRKWAVGLVFGILVFLVVTAAVIAYLVFVEKLDLFGNTKGNSRNIIASPRTYEGSDMPSETGISE